MSKVYIVAKTKSGSEIRKPTFTGSEEASFAIWLHSAIFWNIVKNRAKNITYDVLDSFILNKLVPLYKSDKLDINIAKII